MLSHEIERRLRLPAPDEPAFLPALVLPSASMGFGGVRFRAPGGGSEEHLGLASMRLVFVILALLVAMVGAIAIGALRLDRLPNPFDPNAGFGARGVTLDYPKGWVVAASLSPFNDKGSFTALIVSNAGVSGCSESDLGPATDPEGESGSLEDRIFECVLGKPMAPGEIRLVLSQGYPQKAGVGPYEKFEPTAWFGPDALTSGSYFYVPAEADGWTTTIDGMPAKLLVETTSIVPGADEVRTWGVFPPNGFSGLWFVRATLRGPDLESLRHEADAVALSLRFDVKSPPLDEARRDDALARAIDDVDRETRTWWGSDLYGCFPRSPGQQTTLIDDRLYEYGPDGPLAEPVPVTCATTVESTVLGLWHTTLIVSWDAGDGYAAGEWGWELFFDADGTGAAQGQISSSGEIAYPGTVGELPPPLDGPLVVPVGSIVEVLPPGVDQSGAPIQALWQSPDSAKIGDHVALDARPGHRYYVVDGPISVAGFEWYLVEWQHGTSYGAEFVWLPATDGNRPLIRVVDPACPSADVAVSDLLALLPTERVLCFGDRDMTLDPTIVSLAEANPGGEVEGTPAWLARDSLWRLYGSGGPDGLDGSLPFAIAPALGDALPTGTWLTVHGHFNDAAAATCRRTFPGEWGGYAETPDMQHLRCRELFVITSFETRAAP